jgi:hypothetical protein
MKKFYFIPFFILAGIIFQFSSCDEKSYTVLIENKSSKPVSFKYNGSVELDFLGITDGVDNSKQYTVAPYTQPPRDINIIREYGGNVFSETMTIRMEYNNENIYTFVNSNEITLYVLNKLPIKVVLRADKYIDFNGSTEMKLQPFDTKKDENVQFVAGKIYTATPNFTIYPSQYTVDWIYYNEERTAISVTIR